MASVVKLSPETADDLDRLIASGSFPSREAAVAEGVRRLQEDDAWWRMVDVKVAQARADSAAGRVHSADEVRRELRSTGTAPR